jgi:hypothetical protein
LRLPSWLRDRWVWGALALALVLRLLPLVIWTGTTGGCTRDECTYRILALNIAAGKGMTSPADFLWAPGHPYLLAACALVTGTVYTAKILQFVAALGSVVLMYRIGTRVLDVRAGRVAAWSYALHPTLAYFTGTIWSEVLYSFLLLGAVLSLLWSREGRARRAVLPGVLVGVCVLFRGVATYMAPVFALAAVWPEAGASLSTSVKRRWRHAAVVVAATALTVAPYAVSATIKHGGLLISDATMGQMMWLGNNDFQPITFDYGNGLLQGKAYDATVVTGRAHCAKDLPAAKWDRCETEHGIAWIKEHPSEFVQRIPVRLAQLVNPHTFLTRHVRWGKYPGLPFALKEGLLLYVVATTFLVVLGGTLGAFARARGPFGVLSVGIVAYHVAAIAALAGLSRYRLPLEPLWTIWLAVLLVEARPSLRALVASPLRAVGALLATAGLVPLLLWFLPAGFGGPW